MILINAEQAKELHKELIDNTSGSHGVRDEGLLEAALASACQSFGGEDLYPTTTAKIARIAYGIIRNHPFVDGNKRTGTHVMMVLLKINNINVNFTDNEIVEIGLGIATGKMNDNQLNDIILTKWRDS
jgi:death on curing protein